MNMSEMLSSCLAFAPADRPVVIGHIAFDAVVDHCDPLGLHSGDHVQCRVTSPEHLMVSKPGAAPMILPRRLALFIEAIPDASSN
jgi:hypothetical protein